MRKIVLAATVVLMGLTSASALAASTAVQRVADATTLSQKTALVAEAGRTHDLALEQAILAKATVTVTSSGTGPGVGPAGGPVGGLGYRPVISAGCHYGTISSTHNIDWGAHLGQQIIYVHGWCWDGWKITWTGGHTIHRWASFAYCWKDTSDAQYWNPYPHWQTAEAQGTFGGNAIWGCIGTQFDRPYIDFANGGGSFPH